MTAIAPATAPATTTEEAGTEGRSALSWAVRDTLVVARRNLIRYTRVPQLLVFTFIQPVMFVLLFRYVFGGSIKTPGVAYVDYLMPGIFVQTVVFGSVSTGIGLAEDMQTGLVDRFRSLPMSRMAVLGGRTLADLVRNTFVVLLMLVIGVAVGFRPHGGVPASCWPAAWCWPPASPSRGSSPWSACAPATPRRPRPSRSPSCSR